MIKIGLCDDEKIVLKTLRSLVQECLEAIGEEAEIFLYGSGEELFYSFERLDLIFLDIEMPVMDGIETGKVLKRKGFKGKIIMATGIVGRFKEAFLIEAFRFVTKPFQKQEILTALEDFMGTRLGVREIEVYKDRVAYTFFQKDILWIQAVNSAVELIMKKGIFRKESSLAEMEQALDARMFFRISKQCIVNMQEISRYYNGKIIIQAIEHKVSSRKKKEFEKAYMMFDAEYR